MIELNKFSDVDLSTEQGQLLLAAISVLTSVDEEDIKKRRWGGHLHPDKAFVKIVDLANRIFYESDYRSEKKRKRKEKNRTRIINKILT